MVVGKGDSVLDIIVNVDDDRVVVEMGFGDIDGDSGRIRRSSTDEVETKDRIRHECRVGVNLRRGSGMGEVETKDRDGAQHI